MVDEEDGEDGEDGEDKEYREEVEVKVERVTKVMTMDGFAMALTKWEMKWEKFVHVEGGYVKKCIAKIFGSRPLHDGHAHTRILNRKPLVLMAP